MTLREFFKNRPLIGMVHLGPLPGSARHSGDLEAALRRAVEDARALEAGGMDAVMVENFFDAPFCKASVPAPTIAAMTRAALAVREAVALPVGVNVLRNDAASAVAIAHVCGAQFVRCNVYVGAAVTDQGIIEGAARETVEMRQRLGADVWIWADVGVKHAAPLGDMPLEQQAQDAVEAPLLSPRMRGDKRGADALIVTGTATGQETPIERVRAVKAAAPGTPVLIGSGLNARNAGEAPLPPHAGG